MTKDQILWIISASSPEEAIVELSTEPKMTKTWNPYFWRIEKKQTLRCKIKFDYVEEVNQQRINEGKEPDFESKDIAWGKAINFKPTIIKKNNAEEYYLELIVLEELEKHFYYNWTEISESALSQYLTQRWENQSQWLDNPIDIIMPKVENVVNISF